jgi:hypothetical protein
MSNIKIEKCNHVREALKKLYYGGGDLDYGMVFGDAMNMLDDLQADTAQPQQAAPSGEPVARSLESEWDLYCDRAKIQPTQSLFFAYEAGWRKALEANTHPAPAMTAEVKSEPVACKPVPVELIGQILNEVMDIAVSNGANSVSMPDEYVEVAYFVCFPERYAMPNTHPATTLTAELKAELLSLILECQDMARYERDYNLQDKITAAITKLTNLG